MAANAGNIDIIIDTGDIVIPKCAHGPALLFTRYDQSTKSERQFFACSAFRDRKDCSFFQWSDEKAKPGQQVDSYHKDLEYWPSMDHKDMRKRFLQFKKLKKKQRHLCVTCGLLLLPGEIEEHEGQGHTMRSSVTKEMMTKPTSLLAPLDNNKTYAQYLFSETSVDFVLSTLSSLDVSHVLCVGCPRIHEAIQVQGKTDKESQFTSLLLDLDHRYLQLYPPSRFCRYNMLTHHFFGGVASEDRCINFLQRHCGKVAMVVDPPFGVMTEALSVTIKKIQNICFNAPSTPSLESLDKSREIPVFWFFPYYLEKRVLESNKGYVMLDYKVDYDNHALFKGDMRKKGSPVRMFTNLPANTVVHPQSQGYWFCDVCQRYSAAENKHCVKCKCCPTKDGYTYRHCDECSRCVKPSRAHCNTCGVCDLPNHKCGQTHKEGCHICGEMDHKRRECPNKDKPRNTTSQQLMKRKSSPGRAMRGNKRQR